MENNKNNPIYNNYRTTNLKLGHFPDKINEFHLINSIDMTTRLPNDSTVAKSVQENQYAHPGFVQEGEPKSSEIIL